MPSRPQRLRLRREALAELSADALTAIAGGTTTVVVARSYVDDCPSGRQTCSILCPMSWETEPC